MGWCSATEIFDTVAEVVLTGGPAGEPVSKAEEILQRLYTALGRRGWDCQEDSEHSAHPIVRAIFVRDGIDFSWETASEEDDGVD